MRALWWALLFPGRSSKQYSTDTSHSCSIYLEPEKFNLSPILYFICQKCYPHPPKHSSHSLTDSLLHVYSGSDRHQMATWLQRQVRASGQTSVLAEQNHRQGIRNLDPKQLTGSVSPILWQNPEGSTYRSLNVRSEAHHLRDLCCIMEPAPIWEDHHQNSVSRNTTKTLSSYTISASIIPSPQKPYACKDCEVLLVTKS